MKRILKTRHFCRWMRKTEITNKDLCNAVEEMNQGLIDADLGGGVIKKRIALPGRGKRGGARVLLATNKDNRWFFIFGFEKNDRINITNNELQVLQDIASELIVRTNQQLDTAIENGSLEEICHDFN